MKYSTKVLVSPLSEIDRLLLNACILHWKRMMKWIKDLVENDSTIGNCSVCICTMREDIGEIWNSDCCSLCFEYYYNHNYHKNCLFLKNFKKMCVTLGYNEINFAVTWNDWIKAAEHFIKVMEYMTLEEVNQEY